MHYCIASLHIITHYKLQHDYNLHLNAATKELQIINQKNIQAMNTTTWPIKKQLLIQPYFKRAVRTILYLSIPFLIILSGYSYVQHRAAPFVSSQLENYIGSEITYSDASLKLSLFPLELNIQYKDFAIKEFTVDTQNKQNLLFAENLTIHTNLFSLIFNYEITEVFIENAYLNLWSCGDSANYEFWTNNDSEISEDFSFHMPNIILKSVKVNYTLDDELYEANIVHSSLSIMANNEKVEVDISKLLVENLFVNSNGHLYGDSELEIEIPNLKVVVQSAHNEEYIISCSIPNGIMCFPFLQLYFEADIRYEQDYYTHLSVMGKEVKINQMINILQEYLSEDMLYYLNKSGGSLSFRLNTFFINSEMKNCEMFFSTNNATFHADDKTIISNIMTMGRYSLHDDALDIPKFSFKTGSSKIAGKLKITDILNPFLDMTITSANIEMSELQTYFPQIKFDLCGKLKTNNLSSKIYLSDLSKNDWAQTLLNNTQGTLLFSNAGFSVNQSSFLKNLSGTMSLLQDKLIITNAKGLYQNNIFAFSGEICGVSAFFEEDAKPEIFLEVHSEKFELNTQENSDRNKKETLPFSFDFPDIFVLQIHAAADTFIYSNTATAYNASCEINFKNSNDINAFLSFDTLLIDVCSLFGDTILYSDSNITLSRLSNQPVTAWGWVAVDCLNSDEIGVLVNYIFNYDSVSFPEETFSKIRAEIHMSDYEGFMTEAHNNQLQTDSQMMLTNIHFDKISLIGIRLINNTLMLDSAFIVSTNEHISVKITDAIINNEEIWIDIVCKISNVNTEQIIKHLLEDNMNLTEKETNTGLIYVHLLSAGFLWNNLSTIVSSLSDSIAIRSNDIENISIHGQISDTVPKQLQIIHNGTNYKLSAENFESNFELQNGILLWTDTMFTLYNNKARMEFETGFLFEEFNFSIDLIKFSFGLSETNMVSLANQTDNLYQSWIESIETGNLFKLDFELLRNENNNDSMFSLRLDLQTDTISLVSKSNLQNEISNIPVFLKFIPFIFPLLKTNNFLMMPFNTRVEYVFNVYDYKSLNSFSMTPSVVEINEYQFGYSHFVENQHDVFVLGMPKKVKKRTSKKIDGATFLRERSAYFEDGEITRINIYVNRNTGEVENVECVVKKFNAVEIIVKAPEKIAVIFQGIATGFKKFINLFRKSKK